MKLRPRLDALEARTKPAAGLVICGSNDEAAAHEARDPKATVIVTGVPRTPKGQEQ